MKLIVKFVSAVVAFFLVRDWYFLTHGKVKIK